jgi:triosephosphate isomerase (TIM)
MSILMIANWKATPDSLKVAIKNISLISKISSPGVSKIICAPFVFVPLVKQRSLIMGAQDVSVFSEGAHTGEVTAKMLFSLGVKYVILGHSERRKMGEDREIIKEKISRALSAGLAPVVCVGEKERDSDGEFFGFLREELHSLFKGVPKKNLSKIVIAYEPIWAISTENKGAIDPHILRETLVFIRKIMHDVVGNKEASKIKIIYGGSVDHRNAKEIIKEGGAEGFLVGKASQTPALFEKLLKSIR